MIKKVINSTSERCLQIGLIQPLAKITSVSLYLPFSFTQTAVITLPSRSLSAGSPPFFQLSFLSSPFKPPPNSGIYFLSGDLCPKRAHYTRSHTLQRLAEHLVATRSHSPRSAATFQHWLSEFMERRRELLLIQTLRIIHSIPSWLICSNFYFVLCSEYFS